MALLDRYRYMYLNIEKNNVFRWPHFTRQLTASSQVRGTNNSSSCNKTASLPWSYKMAKIYCLCDKMEL